MVSKNKWQGRRRSRSFETRRSKTSSKKKAAPEKHVQQEQDSRLTCDSSLPLDTIELVSDDVSSIHFCESVTAPPPSNVHRSRFTMSPLKDLLPPVLPPRITRSIQFIRSDSYLDPEMDEKSQEVRSNATPATDNTTQPPPALTYLVYLSLICSKEAAEGEVVVKDSLQNHVLSTLEAQPAWRSTSSSVPVDLDDGLFVDEDDNVSAIDDMALRDLRKGNYKGAIDVLSTLLQSQRTKHHESNVQALYSQLSVLYILTNNPRKALHCALRAKKGVPGFMELGMVNLAHSSPQAALSCWRQALQLQCKLGGYHHFSIPLLLNNMACVHYLEKRGEVALMLLEESLALQREHHAADIRELKDMATCLLNLGMANEQMQNYERALSLVEQGFMVMESVIPQENEYLLACRNALERLTSLIGSNETPSTTSRKRITTMPVFGYSDGIPMRQGTHPVDTILMGSLKVESTLEGRVHKAVVASMSFEGPKSLESVPVDLDGELVQDAELHLSGIHAQVLQHLSRDEIDEALELLRSACKSHKVKYGNVHHLVGTALHNIAMVNLYAKRYKDAQWYFQEAVSVRVAALGTDHPDVSASMLKLGLIQMANGNLDTAYVTFTQVLHTRKKVVGCNHVQVAKILNLIGYLQYEFGSLLAALKSMEEALDILRDQEETTAADTLANMGFLYFVLGDYKEAIAVYQEAYYTQKQILGDLDPKTIVTRENLEYVKEQSSQSIMFQIVDPFVDYTIKSCKSFQSITAHWQGE